MLTTEDYRVQILAEFSNRFLANHNSLADAYALIWAIDVYSSLAWFETGRKGEESKFKDKIEAHCEAFGIVRSASNAIKHIDRNFNNVIVKSLGDITSGSGPSFHAYFANHGHSEPSIAITMNWNFDPEAKVYKDGDGKIISAPKSGWKTQYLVNLYRPAIDGIESTLSKPDTIR
ncbi:hypothetical protein [Roseovarius dicentrarchi]|uniref:hypothetical protein n=1 Tax=Roseovarius dicentrarchi TaxID=2250573 RepID=UPI0013967435|nr:hypothetical protein [Roseovarius dicentrarchi]